jgi:hypothetical protein
MARTAHTVHETWVGRAARVGTRLDAVPTTPTKLQAGCCLARVWAGHLWGALVMRLIIWPARRLGCLQLPGEHGVCCIPNGLASWLRMCC